MSPVVELEGVSKHYRRPGTGAVVTAVDDVTLSVERGEILAVVGYSGAGKSTLVRLINALEKPTAGTVCVAGQEITALGERQLRAERAKIGMIFQRFNLFRSRSVAGNVEYPLKVARMDKAQRDARVAELLDFVGLLDKAHSYPEQLSGGQQQRVGIARALATNPPLLLADEATSALDPETTTEVLGLLRRVNRDLGVTTVVITHEMHAVRQIADRVAVMEAGRVVEVGDVYDLFASPRTPSGKKFVRTALHDRPSEEALARLRERLHGTLVSVAVTDEPDQQRGIDKVFATSDVDAHLVWGGVGEIRERRIGSLTYELTGDPGAVESAVAELRAAGRGAVEVH